MNGIKIGDTVLITDYIGSCHSNGDIGQVVDSDMKYDQLMYMVDVNGVQQWHYPGDIEKVADCDA